MKSILFMMRKTLKNRLLQLRKKPALLVVYALFAALIIWSLLSAGVDGTGLGHITGGETDIGWLKLIFLGYMALFAYTNIQAGLSSGSTFFQMSDVNFMFTSPLNPKGILIYGLARQALRSVLASVFILAMGSTLKTIFGVDAVAMLWLFLGYVFALLVLQLISVVIYMYANSRPWLKKVVWGVVGLCLVPALLAVGLPVLRGEEAGGAILAAVKGNVMFTIPVIGWITEAVFATLAGQAATALIAVGLCFGAVAVAVVLLTAGKTDYYEDVLVATETAWQKQQAVKEGNMQAIEANGGKKVRLGKGGELWGEGARVFLGKHLREAGRRSRFGVLDGASSLGYILMAVLMALFLRGDGGGLLSILISTMMMRTFMVGTGMGLKELYSHYIFMIPESSFAKLVWSNLELGLKSLLESILAYGIAGVLMGESPGMIVASIVMTTLYSVLLISINLLSMRIFANVISQGLLLTLYIFFVLLVMAPGVAAAVLCIVFLGAAGPVLGMAALCLWQVLLSALFFFLSRGVLDTCDIETAGDKR